MTANIKGAGGPHPRFVLLSSFLIYCLSAMPASFSSAQFWLVSLMK